ncbi:hypothetical protein [Candidatus Sororendozoicomonas aggregata]|uniref:hypothetical protein n=1 Tax=Candidatus Sororendozoicomonas aggregata TaxID=3073239 RepID=UPI002ECFBCCC
MAISQSYGWGREAAKQAYNKSLQRREGVAKALGKSIVAFFVGFKVAPLRMPPATQIPRPSETHRAGQSSIQSRVISTMPAPTPYLSPVDEPLSPREQHELHWATQESLRTYQAEQAVSRQDSVDSLADSAFYGSDDGSDSEQARANQPPGHRRLDSDFSDDDDLSRALAASANSQATHLQAIVAQETAIQSMLREQGFDFIKTSRDGNCFYDAICQQLPIASTPAGLRDACSAACQDLSRDDTSGIGETLRIGFSEHIAVMHQNNRDIDQPELVTLPKLLNAPLLVLDIDRGVVNIFDQEGTMQVENAVDRHGVLKGFGVPGLSAYTKRPDTLYVVRDKNHYMGARLPDRQ